MVGKIGHGSRDEPDDKLPHQCTAKLQEIIKQFMMKIQEFCELVKAQHHTNRCKKKKKKTHK